MGKICTPPASVPSDERSAVPSGHPIHFRLPPSMPFPSRRCTPIRCRRPPSPAATPPLRSCTVPSASEALLRSRTPKPSSASAARFPSSSAAGRFLSNAAAARSPPAPPPWTARPWMWFGADLALPALGAPPCGFCCSPECL